MADFYGALESTSFRVKDRAKFLADPDTIALTKHAQADGFFDEDKNGFFSFGWYGQYPSPIITLYDDNMPDGEREMDARELVRYHILPGDVCQIGVSGNEKLRYVGGLLSFVTSKGTVDLDGVTEYSTVITEADLRKIAETFLKQVNDVVPA